MAHNYRVKILLNTFTEGQFGEAVKILAGYGRNYGSGAPPCVEFDATLLDSKEEYARRLIEALRKIPGCGPVRIVNGSHLKGPAIRVGFRDLEVPTDYWTDMDYGDGIANIIGSGGDG
jgi:hypothetical protein